MTYHVKTALLALATALPTHALADWNGAYAGFSLGSTVTNELSGEDDGSSVTYEADPSAALGIFSGYTVQNDDFVFGGEGVFQLAPDAEFEISGRKITVDLDIFDLKGRVGYAVNNILFYGVAGVSRISVDEVRANGFNFGVGADYDLGNNIVIGAEYLARRATVEEDEDDDVALDTLALRTAYRF
ncbi:outer membrane protein [Cognatiyoonia sp. IB215182]|uniref:outer membrane protein n=1 Tax=Cognatiyoonia sp. IB215182 TaxID=3097353 RepID=UPI002A137DFF|nr:outer membrane beta-barrel protein [Cognatiyoonia sp. IB215182]MDX8355860.1 outer membrane beta-barrel protein [Cognatiyoonia sp. IB215182]